MRKSAPLFCALLLSLSARRAWIEMRLIDMSAAWNRLSLSARRAWIEISLIFNFSRLHYNVALRKESVDRNDTMQIVVVVVNGRSPQGERG